MFELIEIAAADVKLSCESSFNSIVPVVVTVIRGGTQPILWLTEGADRIEPESSFLQDRTLVPVGQNGI